MQPVESSRIHLRIEGKVQGVFFRAMAAEEAKRLGLKGWVRNLPDGSVDLAAEGKRKELDALIAWCKQGPPGATVQRVQVQWKSFSGEFHHFRILS